MIAGDARTTVTSPDLYVKLEEARPAFQAMLRIADVNGIIEYQQHVKVAVLENTVQLEACDGFRMTRRVIPHHLGVTGDRGTTYLTVLEVKGWLAGNLRKGMSQWTLPQREIKWPDTDRIIPHLPVGPGLSPKFVVDALRDLPDDDPVFIGLRKGKPAVFISRAGDGTENVLNLTVLQWRTGDPPATWEVDDEPIAQ